MTSATIGHMQRPPVLILAGGANRRFHPLNTSSHKGGLTLHGETLLARELKNLKENGFQDVIITISPRDQESNAIKQDVEQVNQELALNIKYAVQPEAKGMGDAVLIGLSQLMDIPEQIAVLSPYHVTGGDILSQMQPIGELVLCTTPTTNPGMYGIASFDEQGRMNGIVEKPATGTEPSKEKVLSIYILSKHFIEVLKKLPDEQYAFEKALDECLNEKPATALKLEKSVVALKYSWNLFDFQQQFFLEQKSFTDDTAQIAATAVIDEKNGPVVISAGAVIGHCARIAGPAFIGKNARVGDFCLVRESSLEEKVTIGAHSEITRSIFLSGSNIHRGYVGDSIIGAETSLAAGFITANKRFDRKSVPVEVQGKIVDSGRRGFGTIIGEQTKIGTNVSTMPGKWIGSHVTIFPSQTVFKNVPENTVLSSTEDASGSK